MEVHDQIQVEFFCGSFILSLNFKILQLLFESQDNLVKEEKSKFAEHEASITATLHSIETSWTSKHDTIVSNQRAENEELSRQLAKALAEAKKIESKQESFSASTTEKIDSLRQKQELLEQEQIEQKQQLHEQQQKYQVQDDLVQHVHTLEENQLAHAQEWETKFQTFLTTANRQAERNKESFDLFLKLIRGIQRLQDFQVYI